MKYASVVLLLFAGALLFGCLADEPKTPDATNALNESLQKLKIDYNQAVDERDSATTEITALNVELEKERQARATIEARERLTVNELRSAIYNASTSNEVRTKALSSYNYLDNLGCRYYFLTGGYYTGGNFTIPIQCALLVSDYLAYSKDYIDKGDGLITSTQAIIDKNYPQ
ncbi:hypothetical protein AUJ14_05625 [Candidatus Micrarchaeota archaeon CG1_02_55_22]|nr:MAG: hypothetical protein AUJ14_05625 [Candidatus Micrarchaeota archaeon CG1_02_55_22]